MIIPTDTYYYHPSEKPPDNLYVSYRKNPHFAFPNVRQVEFDQVEIKNMTMSAEHYITLVRCTFTSTTWLLTSNTTTNLISGNHANTSSTIDICNCSITELSLLVSRAASDCSITVNDSTIKHFAVVNASSALIENSWFVNGVFGIWTLNTKNLSILGCDFRNVDYSIFAEHTQHVGKFFSYDCPEKTLYNRERISIQDCRFDGGNYGLMLLTSNVQNLIVADSKFQGVEMFSIFVDLYEHGDIVIQNSTIDGG